jgi:hypothetical protein
LGLKPVGVSADTWLRRQMSAFANPSHMPCPDCGASVSADTRSDHVCDPERRADYLMFQLREEIAGFESSVREYLTSPHGRFAQWLAERRRPPLQGL